MRPFTSGRFLTLPIVLRSKGKVIESDEIRFENVPIVTPNGDVLLKSLSFHVKPLVIKIVSLPLENLIRMFHLTATLAYRRS